MQLMIRPITLAAPRSMRSTSRVKSTPATGDLKMPAIPRRANPDQNPQFGVVQTEPSAEAAGGCRPCKGDGALSSGRPAESESETASGDRIIHELSGYGIILRIQVSYNFGCTVDHIGARHPFLPGHSEKDACERKEKKPEVEIAATQRVAEEIVKIGGYELDDPLKEKSSKTGEATDKTREQENESIGVFIPEIPVAEALYGGFERHRKKWFRINIQNHFMRR